MLSVSPPPAGGGLHCGSSPHQARPRACNLACMSTGRYRLTHPCQLARASGNSSTYSRGILVVSLRWHVQTHHSCWVLYVSMGSRFVISFSLPTVVLMPGALVRHCHLDFRHVYGMTSWHRLHRLFLNMKRSTKVYNNSSPTDLHSSRSHGWQAGIQRMTDCRLAPYDIIEWMVPGACSVQ